MRENVCVCLCACVYVQIEVVGVCLCACAYVPIEVVCVRLCACVYVPIEVVGVCGGKIFPCEKTETKYQQLTRKFVCLYCLIYSRSFVLILIFLLFPGTQFQNTNTVPCSWQGNLRIFTYFLSSAVFIFILLLSINLSHRYIPVNIHVLAWRLLAHLIEPNRNELFVFAFYHVRTTIQFWSRQLLRLNNSLYH